MAKLFFITYVIFLPYIHGDSITTVVPIEIELNTTIKSPLRYGFQKTSECQSFEKSFICIQKCLDLNFDVAHADKNCKCTCHIKKDKAKYTPMNTFTRTKWKLGAPTTSIPPWAQDKQKKEKTEPGEPFNNIETDADQVTETMDLNNSTASIANSDVITSSDNISGTASASDTATGNGSDGTADSGATGAEGDTTVAGQTLTVPPTLTTLQ